LPLFTTFDDLRFCEEIENARNSVVVASPGISIQIAESLIATQKRLGAGRLQVVLDVSAEVARLGLGDHTAVELLQAAGVDVRHQSGLRIGILICDHLGWTFYRTPRLIEDERPAHLEAFNSISLTEAQVIILRGELPSTTPDAGILDELHSLLPVVGNERLAVEDRIAISSALKIAPPQKFDLARQTQVYASLIQFVELSFTGFNISSHRVKIPKDLPIIASKDENLKGRLTASLKVLDKFQKPESLKNISARLEELRNAYLIPVGPAGRILLKSKREAFEAELKHIEQDLLDCKEKLKEDLEKKLKSTFDSLVPEIARAVLADPPPLFRGRYQQNIQDAESYVYDSLSKEFPDAADLVDSMKVNVFFKDVTYETLTNKAFSEKVMKAIPRSIIEGALLDEKIVAPAVILPEKP
jgi:hypothetical protein